MSMFACVLFDQMLRVFVITRNIHLLSGRVLAGSRSKRNFAGKQLAATA